jgi:osmotically-inducible protein OsmY
MMNEPPGALQIAFEGDKIVLSGSVSSARERMTIEMAARDAHGVGRVESRLRVRGARAD